MKVSVAPMSGAPMSGVLNTSPIAPEPFASGNITFQVFIYSFGKRYSFARYLKTRFPLTLPKSFTYFVLSSTCSKKASGICVNALDTTMLPLPLPSLSDANGCSLKNFSENLYVPREETKLSSAFSEMALTFLVILLSSSKDVKTPIDPKF